MARKPHVEAGHAARAEPRAARARSERRPIRARRASSTPSWRCWPKSRSSRSALPRSPSRAGVSLAELRDEFGSTLAILAAHVKADRPRGARRRRRRHGRGAAARAAVRRADAPDRGARAAQGGGALADALGQRNPGLALALNGLAVRSQQWMLTAADIGAAGPRGMRARAGARAAVRVGAAHLGRRRRSRSRPHHGRARPRARARPALVRTFSTIFAAFPAGVPPALAAAPTRGRCRRGDGRGVIGGAVAPYTGTRTVARRPPSGLSDRMMSPPCERAMSRAMASPRPVPPSS